MPQSPCLYTAFRRVSVEGAQTKKFFEVFDNLDLQWDGKMCPKILVKISEFSEKQKNVAHCSLDPDKVRWFCRLLTSGRLGAIKDGKHFESYGGGKNPSGESGYKSPTGFVARRIVVERAGDGPKKTADDQSAFYVTIENGPGRKTDTGAFTIDKSAGPVVKTSMKLNENELITMALKLEAFLQLWLAKNYEAVRASYVDEYTAEPREPVSE